MPTDPRNAVTVPADRGTVESLDLSSALAGRRLLDHPFYRRWERGEVSMDELADYAGQYRHFEACIPGFLKDLVAQLPEGAARDLVAANLADEEGDPVAHVELFERFATAVGASAGIRTAASPATRALIDCYAASLAEGPVAALAGFVAYECQASEVARAKADGLRAHYGLDDFGVSFWEHHAQVDARHSEWALGALEDLSRSYGEETDEQIQSAFGRGADAWWSFLDEREAAAVAR
ncbi:MAG: TenA family transcriptional regulator [Acidimicrobiales bacterium]